MSNKNKISKLKNVRARAAKYCEKVAFTGFSLSDVLEDETDSLCKELCYGVCRYWCELDAVAAHLLQKPMKAKDADVLCLLLVGFYQLKYLRVPDHASINETVNACRDLQKQWASKLLNALLRRFQRERDKIEAMIEESEQARFAHPQWFIDMCKAQYPEQWQVILEANNQRPPLTLRVNLSKTSREDYVALLQEAGFACSMHADVASAVCLDSPCDVTSLPKFAEGWVSVQDASAQRIAFLPTVSAGMRVLDACCAPGGKLVHLLERESALQMMGVDIDAARLVRVQENCDRVGVKAELITMDASRVGATDLGSELFDLIVLDAPCTATGVIRRHPDIKLLREQNDVAKLAETQATLFDSLWKYLKPGGQFIYATCSVLAEENAQQVDAFVQKHADAVLVESLQSLPGAANGFGIKDSNEDSNEGYNEVHNKDNSQSNDDGFYHALLTKKR